MWIEIVEFQLFIIFSVFSFKLSKIFRTFSLYPSNQDHVAASLDIPLESAASSPIRGECCEKYVYALLFAVALSKRHSTNPPISELWVVGGWFPQTSVCFLCFLGSVREDNAKAGVFFLGLWSWVDVVNSGITFVELSGGWNGIFRS